VVEALQGLMHSAAAAGPAVAPGAVLLLQNGWGSADEARAVLPAEVSVFSSIMMIGIERRSPTHVNVNVQASPVRVGTLFGAAPGFMQDVVARGQAGFLPITFEHEIEPAILNKFLFNTCLNAIGAITRMSYGELVSNAHTRHLITQVADETLQVIGAERQFPLAASGERYVYQTLTPFVLPKAAAHRSSMLQDVEAGRRTETDYLNGAVVRMGRRHGITTPFNDAVASLVRSRESGVASSSAAPPQPRLENTR
jgi:2-dehydropantoate 2-reductase